MAFHGEVLYVGTGGGVLLALKCPMMELQFSFHAYNGAIRSLLLVSPETQPKIRTLSDNIISKTPTTFGCSTAVEKQQKDPAETPTSKKCPLSLKLKPMEPLPAEQTVLISFGAGYKGVVGESMNCPQEFILPSVGRKVTTKPAKPSKSDGHLLLWSVEVTKTKRVSLTRIDSSPSKLQSLY